MSDTHQLFLHQCFYNLNRADVQLSIPDYLAALRLVEQGLGLADKEELYRLCRLIWLKSKSQEVLFRQVFDDTWDKTRRAIQAAATVEARPSLPPPNWREGEHPPKDKTVDKDISKPVETASEAKTTTTAETITSISLSKPTERHSPREFLRYPAHLPITLRHLKQFWHYLRRYQRTGRPTELDLEATIDTITITGRLLQPVLVAPRTNQTRLLLLLDQGGSMVPFHFFSQYLRDSAEHGGRLQVAGVYYFRNVPRQYLYRDTARLHGLALNDFFFFLAPNTIGLIFSDAGAARQSYNDNRIAQTQEFLAALRPRLQRLVWLNPLPRRRWHDTSATEIAQAIPMFELTRLGLSQAIKTLNGVTHD